MKSGTILIYNCSGPEFSKLRQIFAMLRLRMRPVSPDRYQLSLLELAEGTGEPTAEAETAIPENLLVFCGLGDALLHQVLEVIRMANLPPIQLKAVLTGENREWNSHQLYEELVKEREAVEAQEKGQG